MTDCVQVDIGMQTNVGQNAFDVQIDQMYAHVSQGVPMIDFECQVDGDVDHHASHLNPRFTFIARSLQFFGVAAEGDVLQGLLRKISEIYSVGKAKSLIIVRSVYRVLFSHIEILNENDVFLSATEVITDVLKHPVRELQGFLQSLVCTVDNVSSFFNPDSLIMDPVDGKMKSSAKIFCSKTLKFCLSSLLSSLDSRTLLALATSGYMATTGHDVSRPVGVISMMVLLATTFQPAIHKLATLSTLHDVLNLRQIVRFLLLSSLILFAWKVGGKAWGVFSNFFNTGPAEHAGGADAAILIVASLLVTWLSGHYAHSVVVNFLKSCSLIGGGGAIFSTLSDCVTFVARLLAQFFAWLGFEGLSAPFEAFASKKDIDAYTRRGGVLSRLVPAVTSFLASRPIGAGGPGTTAYVEEGRELIAQIDHMIQDIVNVEGAGFVHASLLRYREKVIAAIESSLFCTESANERVEPAFINFVGGPRMGKSFFVTSLINAMRSVMVGHVNGDGAIRQTALLAKENRWCYSRNSADPFFSGYNRQPVIFYDDIFTANNAVGNDPATQKHEQELGEIQSLVSSQTYRPNFPEVGAGVSCPKGMCIAPAWVISTSNYMFPDTRARQSCVIDDRITKTILVVHDPSVPKGPTFGHLQFWVLKHSLSHARAVMNSSGWTGPYSFKGKQFPYTTQEFHNWPLRVMFERVQISDLVKMLIDCHQQKLLELQIRRQGAHFISHDGTLPELDVLVESLHTVCDHYNLEFPDLFEERVMALGLQNALESLHPAGCVETLQYRADGPIVINLKNGRFTTEVIDEPVCCTCSGGHLTLMACPKWKQLQIPFAFVRKRTTSQPRRVPHYVLHDDGRIEVTASPANNHQTFWRNVTQDLSVYCTFPCVLDRMPISSEVMFIDQDYQGIVFGVFAGVIESVGFKMAERETAWVVLQDDTVVELPWRQCLQLNQVNEHAYNRFDRIVNLFMIGPTLTDWYPVLDLIVKRREDINAPEPTEHEMIEVARACAQLLEYHRPLLESDIGALRGDCLRNEPIQTKSQAQIDEWYTLFKVAIDRAAARSGVAGLEQLVPSRLQAEISANMHSSYAGFAWRMCSLMLYTSQQRQFERQIPFRWYFVELDGTKVIATKRPGLTLVLTYIGGREPFEFRTVPSRWPLTRQNLLQAFPGIENLVDARTLESFANFLNISAGAGERDWFSKLQERAWNFYRLIVQYYREILVGLMAFATAFLASKVFNFASGLVREHSGANAIAGYHSARLFSGHQWESHYEPILRTIKHPNAAGYKRANGKFACKLCDNLQKRFHSDWDPVKQVKLVRLIVNEQANNRQLVKRFCKGMYDFNCACLEILELSDRDEVRQRLMQLALLGKVPCTASGVSRHALVYIAWNCKAARMRARATMLAQNAELIQSIGNSELEPLYECDRLILPESCRIPSVPLECCYDSQTCQHVSEHAYYLPDAPVVCTATERTVALASSSTGLLAYNGIVHGRGAMLADGVLFAPAHVIRGALQSEGQEWYWRGSTRFLFSVNMTNVCVIPETDLALIKVQHNELSGCAIDDLVDGKDVCAGDKVSIVRLDSDLSKHPVVVTILPKQLAGYPSNYFLVDKYLAPGDSGSLVLRGGRIIGHYYGATNTAGICVKWPSHIVKRVREMWRSPFYDSRAVLCVEPDTGFAVVDYFDTRTADSNPASAERETELKAPLEKRGVFSVKAPASQSQRALAKAVAKWEPVEEVFDADYKASAAELAGYFGALIETQQGGKCLPFSSWDASINGREPMEPRKIKKIDMSTSAGAPWCDSGISKSELIDDHRPDWLVCRPQLVTLLDRCEQLIQSGNVAGYTATANLKDELRDLARVEQEKTRLFCATPIHHNILFRKYFGRWIHAFKALDYAQGMHAMGTDVYGEDWNNLYSYLMSPPAAPKQEPHAVFLAGDFGRFDTSHSGWKMRQAFAVAADACSDPVMCDALGMSIGRFALRYGGREFLVPAGLPSGCQMTTPINCVLNQLLWLTIWRKATGQGLDHFMKHCRLVVYGDDVVLSIDQSNPFLKRLEPVRIQEWMKELGYTLESADDKPLRWVELPEVTFLKRHFVPDPLHPGVVHAPRPLDEVFTQLMWRKHEGNEEAQKCCFAMFAAEIGQHPKTVQAHVIGLIGNIIARESLPEYIKQAYLKCNFKRVVQKSYDKQLELQDLISMYQAYLRLW